ncbi:MAG: hypothetical protein QOE07_698 [Acidimicrobiaceae bacterium]|nr:hypothetical protein [Acidimicrobiaceae bacterium]MDQ1412110.1 hypothetical protein [Acidimicrobiaceae bacterium]
MEPAPGANVPKKPEETEGETVLSYAYVQDKQFVEVLNARTWEENSDYGGLVLQGACPICGHPDAIDVFVPIVIAAFKAGAEVSKEYAECQCGENHNPPSGKSGCGRWGLVSPRVGGG